MSDHQVKTKPADAFYESYEARRQSAKALLGFSLVYLTDYSTDPLASFHPQLVHALEDQTDKTEVSVDLSKAARDNHFPPSETLSDNLAQKNQGAGP